MPLARLQQPFDYPHWLFEVTYDGWRALAHLDDSCVRLVSRRNNVFKSFPDLSATMAACLKAESAVLDGEIVHLGRNGRPEFNGLMRRGIPQHFYAFDVLWLDGRDTPTAAGETQADPPPRGADEPAPVLYAGHFDERGIDLFRAVCEMDPEGIVAKRKDGLYTPEETSWVKIKNPQYTHAEGRRELFEKQAARAGCV